ncbi:MAG: PTS sugar transporter subunit IIA [Pseudomonadota bacterium]
MSIAALLAPERIRIDVAAKSKKRALEQLSVLLAEGDEDLSSTKVFDALLARERLGSTGLGFGIAIPHARYSDATEARAACMRLSEPVDFDSIDREPIDFVVGLLVPDAAIDEHIQTLADLAGLLSESSMRDALRAADDAQCIMRIMNGGNGHDHGAA